MAKKCAYCGGLSNTNDHVIPKNLYPISIRKQNVQLLTVPSCDKCNAGFSDDEEHFRNIITVGGYNSPIVNELFYYKVYPSFSNRKSLRHLHQLWNDMNEINTSNGKRHIIYPMRDKKFVRILKKIFSGLCFYHFRNYIPKENIYVDVLKDEIPKFIIEENWYNIVPEVFEYLFGIYITEEGYVSLWMIRFFENRYYLGKINIPEIMHYEQAIDLRR